MFKKKGTPHKADAKFIDAKAPTEKVAVEDDEQKKKEEDRPKG